MQEKIVCEKLIFGKKNSSRCIIVILCEQYLLLKLMKAFEKRTSFHIAISIHSLYKVTRLTKLVQLFRSETFTAALSGSTSEPGQERNCSVYTFPRDFPVRRRSLSSWCCQIFGPCSAVAAELAAKFTKENIAPTRLKLCYRSDVLPTKEAAELADCCAWRFSFSCSARSSTR